jgi:hypothetical protein
VLGGACHERLNIGCTYIRKYVRTSVRETRGTEVIGVWFQVAGPVVEGVDARVKRIVLLMAWSPPPICGATQDVQL